MSHGLCELLLLDEQLVVVLAEIEVHLAVLLEGVLVLLDGLVAGEVLEEVLRLLVEVGDLPLEEVEYLGLLEALKGGGGGGYLLDHLADAVLHDEVLLARLVLLRVELELLPLLGELLVLVDDLF